MAYQGHIVIPTAKCHAENIIEQTEAAMAVKFGGYSRYEGSGGWDGENGVVTEPHVRLVVNVPEEHHFNRGTFKSWLQIEATYIKDQLDEEAVLIEIHEMEMELV